MRCSEFLENYSDYRDGVITDAALLDRLAYHSVTCARCMCYDASVARGVMALRATSDLEPSPGFRRRLRGRLSEDTTPQPAAPASLAIVGLLVLAAMTVILQDSAEPDARPSTALERPTRRPLPVVVANPGVPFVTFVHLSAPPFGPTHHDSAPPEQPLGTRATLPR